MESEANRFAVIKHPHRSRLSSPAIDPEGESLHTGITETLKP